MKIFQKKNNKGFSLVELIVVVAIMAVLMGVLIPVLVTNIEKSKHQKDLSALAEIVAQMNNVACDAEYCATVDGKVEVTGGSFTWSSCGGSLTVGQPGKTVADYLKSVANYVDNTDNFTFTYSSKMNAADTKLTITFVNGKAVGTVTSKTYGTEALEVKNVSSSSAAAPAATTAAAGN